MSGQEVQRADISGMTNANPCVVTTSSAHGFSSDYYVRLTDLNGMIPVPRGMEQINNGRFKIIVLSSTTFSLKWPITGEDVNSIDYTPYVTGGSVNRIAQNFEYEA